MKAEEENDHKERGSQDGDQKHENHETLAFKTHGASIGTELNQNEDDQYLRLDQGQKPRHHLNDRFPGNRRQLRQIRFVWKVHPAWFPGHHPPEPPDSSHDEEGQSRDE